MEPVTRGWNPSLADGTRHSPSRITRRGCGYGIVGLFVVSWLAALAVWRFGRIEEKWSSDLQPRTVRLD
jgi:hypothetical protein